MKALLFYLVACVAVVAGVLVPRLLIADVDTGDSAQAPFAAKYARVRVGNAGGAAQKGLRVETRVVEMRPDPSGCDWGYREPISAVVIVRTYTLWGVPWETWEVGCNYERLMSGAL